MNKKILPFCLAIFFAFIAICQSAAAVNWLTDTNTGFLQGDFNYTYARNDGNLSVTGTLDWNKSKVYPAGFDSNLLLYLTFDSDDRNSTNVFDITSYNHQAAIIGSPDFNNSLWDGNSFYSKENASNYIDVLDSSDWDLGDFTIDFWMRPTGGTSRIFTIGGITGIDVRRTSTIYTVYVTGSSGTFYSAPVHYLWQKFTLTRQGSTVTLYLNGRSYGSQTFNNSQTAPTYFYIGKIVTTTSYDFFDEFKVYRHALTAQQVEADYNAYFSSNSWGTQTGHFASYSSKIYDAGKSVDWNALRWSEDANYGGSQRNEPSNDVNLLGYWTFDALDSNATHIYDLSPNHRDANFVNGADNNAIGIFDTNAGYFDGTDDYLDAGRVDLNNDNFTVSAWVSYEGLSANTYRIFSNYDAGLSKGFSFQIITDGTTNQRVQLAVYGVGGGSVTANAYSALFRQKKWHHVAGVFDKRNIISLYIDGIQSTATSVTLDLGSIYSIRTLTIGGAATTEYFKGYIDEAKIYNRVLSAAEIKKQYTQGVTDVKFQARSCDDAFCSGEVWLGPDGTSSTYYDYGNNWFTLPSAITNSRYFQWRTYFDSKFFDGNFSPSFPKISSVNVDYPATSPPVGAKVYSGTTGKPRSFFGAGERVRIVAEGNDVNSSFAITITDSNGNVLINAAPMTTISDTNYVEFYYDVNGSIGWYDATIDIISFGNLFYQGETWASRNVDSNGTTFPFTFDLNVSRTNDINRFFEVIDARLDFNYSASQYSIRVLDWNGSRYLEIPSQTYNKAMNGNYVSSANLVFLSSMEKNEDRNYVVAYTAKDYNKTYNADLTAQINPSTRIFETSILKAEIDLNKGGSLSNAWSKYPNTTTDVNGYLPMQLAPEAKSGVTTYSIAAYSPSHSFDANGSVFSKYKSWGTTGNMDYNITYTFYAKKDYFIVDINAKPTASETWDYYYDSYFGASGSKFDSLAYFNGTLNTGSVSSGDGSDVAGITDLNYLGLYTKSTMLGLGNILLNSTSTRSYSKTTDFYDSTSYEYWKRNFYAGSVSTSDKFTSKQAVVLFNAYHNYDDLNTAWIELKNPAGFVTGSTTNSDTIAPDFNQTYYSPANPTDQNTLTCYAGVGDNLGVMRVDLNISKPGEDINASFSLNDLNRSVWRDFNSYPYPGFVDCNFTVYDFAGNSDSNGVTFFVADTIAPSIWNVYNSPDTNALLDWNTTIRIDANITDYYGLRDANLLLRNGTNGVSWSDWNSIAMNCTSIGDYNHNCSASFTSPSNDRIYEYKIYAKDNTGNDVNSSAARIYAYHEWTWIVSTRNLGAFPAIYDSNAVLDTLTVTNTSDSNFSFNVRTNWEDKSEVFINGTPEGLLGFDFNLGHDENFSLDINVLAKTITSSDDLNIIINPSDVNASPDVNSVLATIESYAGGPFMFIQWLTYDTTVTQDDNAVEYSVRVTNKGNSDANNFFITWSLPSDFSLADGLNDSNLDLAVDEYWDNIISVDISDTATVGDQTITVYSGCCNDANYSKQKSLAVAVAKKSTTTTTDNNTTTIVTVTETTGGSGSGPRNSSGGGGGGSTSTNTTKSDTVFSTIEQKEAFFHSIDVFELVRGKTGHFVFTLNNPLDAPLLNVNFAITGYLDKYLSLENSFIPLLDVNDSVNVRVNLAAPKYFSSGKYDLTVVITGLLDKADENILFKEERSITLYVAEVSKSETKKSISGVFDRLKEMEGKGFFVDNLKQELSEAKALVNARDYEAAKNLAEKINMILDEALEVNETIANLQAAMGEADSKWISTPNTKRLVLTAESAFKRGDYSSAIAALKEAEMTLALETKGEINPLYVLANTWHLGLAALLGISAAGFLAWFSLLKWRLGKRVEGLHREENKLLELIGDLQRKTFVDAKISLGEYAERLERLEERLGEVVSEAIKLDTIRRYLFRFFITQEQRLLDERQKLLALIKDLQKRYFEKETMDIRVYRMENNTFLRHLSEIEEDLADVAYKKALKEQNPLNRLWNKIIGKK